MDEAMVKASLWLSEWQETARGRRLERAHGIGLKVQFLGMAAQLKGVAMSILGVYAAQ
jgi:hypothetical protein